MDARGMFNIGNTVIVYAEVYTKVMKDTMRTVQGRIGYTIDEAMGYGDMAPSLLTSMYEETDMGNDEDLYDNHARGILTDWGPDTNLMAHEAPRSSDVTSRAGRLNLIYGGDRGTVDTPYVPERFDQFIGVEDRDPRGINADGAPDFKVLKDQYDDRMRFIRWTPDSCNNITGGGRAERREIADHQAANIAMAGRLNIFDRQLDGRREGIRREYDNVSAVPKSIQPQSYGDLITDFALNPQRKTITLCKEIIRAGKAWREETIDADWSFARYTQICKGGVREHNGKSKVESSDNDTMWKAESQPIYFKAAGLLMSNIVKQKAQEHANIRADNTEVPDAAVEEVAARKTMPLVRDLRYILDNIGTDTRFSSEVNTINIKTPSPQTPDHRARVAVYNHITPAHHYLNAEIIYKHVALEGDARKAKDLVITDARDTDPGMVGVNHLPFKTARRDIDVGAKLGSMIVPGTLHEGRKTHNYKAAMHANGDKRVSMFAKDATVLDESTNSQHRRPQKANYRGNGVDDTVEDMHYGDNSYLDRRARGLGSKYTMQFIDRDSRADGISVAN